MKTQITKAPEVFKPVSITITFETQRELDAFATAMNHPAVAGTIEEMAGLEEYTLLNKITKTLADAGADIDSKFKEFSESILKWAAL
jgi:hypothetical protein